MIETKRTFDLAGVDTLIFLGMHDVNLKIIQEHFDARIIVRGQHITMSGEEETINQLENLFSEIVFYINKFRRLDRRELETFIRMVRSDTHGEHPKTELNSVVLFTENEYIKPRSEGQQRYVDSVKEHEIVFSIGPAGTGKTFLAVAMAVQYLKSKKVKRIILSRPAVEAGESLGYLPGDLREKIDPYLWPLYDALNDMLSQPVLKKYMENDIIEIIPLAYMRGRTLNNAFVILDEAQNSTTIQMKMFLTRLGANSCAIITGDITQIDLRDKSQSGLVQIQHVLKGVEGIDFIYLESTDVVRHRLVKDIIEAYEKFSTGGNNNNTSSPPGQHSSEK